MTDAMNKGINYLLKFIINLLSWGRRDRMVVRFTTTYAIIE
jgi:hypothetical protein